MGSFTRTASAPSLFHLCVLCGEALDVCCAEAATVPLPMNEMEAMDRALALALKGWGRVSPNPLVGAVLLRDGQVVGEGCHAEFGGPHAEVAALASCPDPRGTTCVVTRGRRGVGASRGRNRRGLPAGCGSRAECAVPLGSGTTRPALRGAQDRHLARRLHRGRRRTFAVDLG